MMYFVVLETPTQGDYWLCARDFGFSRNYDNRLLMTLDEARNFQNVLLNTTFKGNLVRVAVKEDSEKSLNEFKERWLSMEVSK